MQFDSSSHRLHVLVVLLDSTRALVKRRTFVLGVFRVAKRDVEWNGDAAGKCSRTRSLPVPRSASGGADQTSLFRGLDRRGARLGRLAGFFVGVPAAGEVEEVGEAQAGHPPGGGCA